MSAGRLLLCPTPIGNLGDLSPRVADALMAADVVLCEDTRRTGGLLARLATERGQARPPMRSLHEHNERRQVDGLVAELAGGMTMALCSDAGTPVVSDPGLMLVRGAIAGGITIEALPGPSAVLVALAASGLAADRWQFIGFVPRKGDVAAALLGDATTIAFEAPGRIAATVAAIADADPGRAVCVCRELTKLHEEYLRGSAEQVADQLAAAPVKGEITLVVAGEPASDTGDEAAAIDAVRRLVAAGARARDAAGVVAELTGTRPNRLYRAVLAD